MRSFMTALLTCSVTMSALALFYMAVTPLLAKRYSVTGRYYAWLVIVIGLIVPFRPRFPSAILQVDMPADAAVPLLRVGAGAPGAPAGTALPAALPGLSWWRLAAAVWLAGVVLFLAYHALRHVRFLRLTARWSENVTDRQALALLQDLKAEMGLSKTIGLQICDSIGSPMMIGLVSPRILLPRVDFAKDELRFILKHELVHHKRKDLWYKCLVLTATAIHWFDPVVYWMARAVAAQCEASCDAEVVRSTGADTRRSYSETIIGVVRYRSKLKTAFSTNFYGGKKGMKTRIFSIMDMSRKKAGLSILCGALVLTMGTGAAFAANAEAPAAGPDTVAEPRLPIAFRPDPDVYAPYAAFGISVSADGGRLLYEGQPVRLFADSGADTEAFYSDGDGAVDLSVVRNAAGAIAGIQRIDAQTAQAYRDAFFGDDLVPVNVQDRAEVRDTVLVGPNKYGQYQPFGITCSETDGALYFQGRRVRSFVDQLADGQFEALWSDAAGTADLAVTRDGSGQIAGIEGISADKAREYFAASEGYGAEDLAKLEAEISARVDAKYAQD